MDLLQRYIDHIKAQHLFSVKDKLLLAVSGGIDSVALCELCKQAGYVFAIAHCNFKLRDEESERDKKFVEGVAKKYDIPFFLKEFDTKKYALDKKISIQEAARELRYNWFREIRKDNNYDYVLTAHHADDNIETVMMNFFRGTGIKGLKGMEAKHDRIVRPLLFARRSELEEFVSKNKLGYVTDSSNLHDDYSRNNFRLNIIPALQKIYPEVNENVLRNIERFNEISDLYGQAIEQQKKKLFEIKGEEVHIPVLKLRKTTPLQTIVYEIIKDFGFSSQQVNEVIALLDSETGKYINSSTHRILKNRNWLIISPLKTITSEIGLIEQGVFNFQFSIFNFQFSFIPTSNLELQTSNSIANLDSDEITFPLILRKWKQGDYFYPLGMKKKKKLSRFFIDQRLSKNEKEKIWVLEMDKKIIWVIGHRIDERFKITDKTKNILKITYFKNQTE